MNKVSHPRVLFHYGNISVQKLPPDLHLTYSKNGRKSGVDIEIIKSDIFQNFSFKSNVVDIY